MAHKIHLISAFNIGDRVQVHPMNPGSETPPWIGEVTKVLKSDGKVTVQRHEDEKTFTVKVERLAFPRGRKPGSTNAAKTESINSSENSDSEVSDKQMVAFHQIMAILFTFSEDDRIGIVQMLSSDEEADEDGEADEEPVARKKLSLRRSIR